MRGKLYKFDDCVKTLNCLFEKLLNTNQANTVYISQNINIE